jgi:hypothetical protein
MTNMMPLRSPSLILLHINLNEFIAKKIGYPQLKLVGLAKKLHYVKKSKSHYFFSALILNKKRVIGRKIN